MPARDVYGMRVAKSEFGYRSLGAGSPNVTERAALPRGGVPRRLRLGAGRPGRRAQGGAGGEAAAHHARRPGRAAGARQAVRRLGDELARLQRGADVKLPGSSGPAVGFLMYPQAETGKERLDSLDPDNFKYTITAREIKA